MKYLPYFLITLLTLSGSAYAHEIKDKPAKMIAVSESAYTHEAGKKPKKIYVSHSDVLIQGKSIYVKLADGSTCQVKSLRSNKKGLCTFNVKGKSKLYVSSKFLKVTPKGIFIKYKDKISAVPTIGVDALGIFTLKNEFYRKSISAKEVFYCPACHKQLSSNGKCVNKSCYLYGW